MKPVRLMFFQRIYPLRLPKTWPHTINPGSCVRQPNDVVTPPLAEVDVRRQEFGQLVLHGGIEFEGNIGSVFGNINHTA